MDKSVLMTVKVGPLEYVVPFRICRTGGQVTAFSIDGKTLPQDTVHLPKDLDLLDLEDEDEREALEQAIQTKAKEISRSTGHKRRMTKLTKT